MAVIIKHCNEVKLKINLKDLSQKVANTALEVTPIINLPDPPSVIPVGCGLFLKIKEDRYLISAGHLLNLENWPQLVVPGDNDKLVRLNGTIYTTYENPDTVNKIDFAVLKFAKRQNKHFLEGKFSFSNPSNIILNHKVNKSGNYVISGYPVTGVKKTYGEPEFTPIPLKFLTHPVEDIIYKRNDFNPDHFILLNYRRKLAPFGSTQKQITKQVTGISGSGLWYVPDWNERKGGIPKFYLVGIMVENYKDKGFVAALRIDFITETIKQFFDDTAFQNTHFDFGDSIKNLYGSEIK